MRICGRRWAAIAIAAGFTLTAASAACPGRFAVEVLGSGGPLADDNRASSGYLVWIDGKAKLLVDAGGGTFLRFAEAGASLSDLEGILLTHLHADHVSDLPAILKSGSFEGRTAELPVIGPTGNEYFPGLGAFLQATFNPETGAYRYLGGYLAGAGGLPALTASEIDVSREETTAVINAGPLTADAIPVNHGDVPALGYVVTVDGAAAVFAGDQSRFSSYFEQMLENTQPALLIAHHAIRDGKGQPRGLHRAPSSIGEMAAALKAGRLVLSHNMKRALDDIDAGRDAIRASYDGPVDVAVDQACYTVLP